MIKDEHRRIAMELANDVDSNTYQEAVDKLAKALSDLEQRTIEKARKKIIKISKKCHGGFEWVAEEI